MTTIEHSPETVPNDAPEQVPTWPVSMYEASGPQLNPVYPDAICGIVLQTAVRELPPSE